MSLLSTLSESRDAVDEKPGNGGGARRGAATAAAASDSDRGPLSPLALRFVTRQQHHRFLVYGAEVAENAIRVSPRSSSIGHKRLIYLLIYRMLLA